MLIKKKINLLAKIKTFIFLHLHFLSILHFLYKENYFELKKCLSPILLQKCFFVFPIALLRKIVVRKTVDKICKIVYILLLLVIVYKCCCCCGSFSV